ncbi:hypothetical protein Glove_187g91 [Diversispora epigaea]|uniref:HMG box domain-containing protein n=1 Tax=Diversispora epigaea TaxID=1348612 RepID=A0A397IVA6_9GLOM|nr:hypothetical protein Glove_187g91 [Diversispora epigaea]
MTSHQLSHIPVGRDHLFFIRDECDYYVSYVSHHYDHGIRNVKYNVAGVETTGSDRRPATAFILHRKSMQECFNVLNLKLKRQEISKISNEIWKDLSKTDPQLINTIKESYRTALKEYRRTHFRIQTYEGPQGSSRVNNNNGEVNRDNDDNDLDDNDNDDEEIDEEEEELNYYNLDPNNNPESHYPEFDYHFYNPTAEELVNDLFLENRDPA